MNPRKWSAMILVALMAMAGCLGGTEPATPPEDPVVETYSLTPTWVVSPEQIQLGEEAAFVLNIMQEGEGSWSAEPKVFTPSF